MADTTAATATAPPADPRAFAPFEWMIARRYLRARRKEGFISVIAGFSFLGIMLGVVGRPCLGAGGSNGDCECK